MALIVGTNSYETVAEADAYFDTRVASDDWFAASADTKEKALITATAMIDENVWIGTAVSPSQALAWPRNNATYADLKLGLVVTITSDSVPDRVLIAIREQALHLIQNAAVIGGSVEQVFESISIGSISLSDSNSTKKTPRVPLSVRQSLKPLLRQSTIGSLWRAW